MLTWGSYEVVKWEHFDYAVKLPMVRELSGE
jgi:hypothetical protein